MGTGQRSFIVYTFLAFLFSVSYIQKIKLKSLFIPGFLIFIVFGITSYYLGRTDDFSFFGIITEIVNRVFFIEQYDSLIAFRYIYDFPTSFGMDWFQSLKGILPGVKGSDLQHKVFELIHGTDRGTAAISTIASIYYNFSIIGVAFFAVIISFFYNYLTLIF